MASTADFRMPGAYHIDGPSAAGQALNAGIFRPPVSPSASSSLYNLNKSTTSLYSDMSMANTPVPGAKRKRAGTEIRGSTPIADWAPDANDASDVRGGKFVGASSAQARYTLAGQMDTPGGVCAPGADTGMLEESVYSDVDYRRALGPKRQKDGPDPSPDQLSSVQVDAAASEPPVPTGWSAIALNTIGEVVGKVWEFCKAGAFRGFHAGGGRGYEFNEGAATESSASGARWCDEHDMPTLQESEHAGAPGPGHPAQPDCTAFRPDYRETSTLEATPTLTPTPTPTPAAKRRHLDETGDELRQSWVMVREQPPQAPAPATTHSSPVMQRPSPRQGMSRSQPPRSQLPRSQLPRHSTSWSTTSNRRISVSTPRVSGRGSGPSTPNVDRRASLRVSHAGSPILSARSPASFATAHSPSVVSSPPVSRIPVPLQPAGLGPNPFASSASRSSSLAGMTPPAPARRTQGAADDSPRPDSKARQPTQKRLSADLDADARMEAFNNRLMAMIRQGKEALGTTVEVEMEMDGGGGGGWEDEE